jgi:hypothetical protein
VANIKRLSESAWSGRGHHAQSNCSFTTAISLQKRESIDLFNNRVFCAPNGSILEQLLEGFFEEDRKGRVECHADDRTVREINPGEDGAQEFFALVERESAMQVSQRAGHFRGKPSLSKPWNDKSDLRPAKEHEPEALDYSLAQQGQGPQGVAHLLAIVGPDTMWPESGSQSRRDTAKGLDLMIMLINIPDSKIYWTQPQDLPLTILEANDLRFHANTPCEEVFVITVASRDKDISGRTWKDLATISGHEKEGLADIGGKARVVPE